MLRRAAREARPLVPGHLAAAGGSGSRPCCVWPASTSWRSRPPSVPASRGRCSRSTSGSPAGRQRRLIARIRALRIKSRRLAALLARRTPGAARDLPRRRLTLLSLLSVAGLALLLALDLVSNGLKDAYFDSIEALNVQHRQLQHFNTETARRQAAIRQAPLAAPDETLVRQIDAATGSCLPSWRYASRSAGSDAAELASLRASHCAASSAATRSSAHQRGDRAHLPQRTPSRRASTPPARLRC